MKKNLILLFGIILVLILFSVALINNGILRKTGISEKKEEVTELTIKYKIIDVSTPEYATVVTIIGEKPLKQISFYDGVVVECNNRIKMARDMKLEPFVDYGVTITYDDGEEINENIRIDNVDREFEYTGGVQKYYVPVTGYYTLQACGASGGWGYEGINPPGLGGVTEGSVYLEKGQMLYIQVGAAGIGQTVGYSYNGGGSAYTGEISHKGGQGRRSH